MEVAEPPDILLWRSLAASWLPPCRHELCFGGSLVQNAMQKVRGFVEQLQIPMCRAIQP